MFVEFFCMFGLAWWILFGFLSFIMCLSLVEGSQKGWATGAFITILVVWFFLGDLKKQFSIGEWNITQALIGVVIYFVIGIIYSYVRWFCKIVKRKDAWVELRTKFLTERKNLSKNDPIPANMMLEFANWIGYHGDSSWIRYDKYFEKSIIDPRIYVKEYIAEIACWIGYWPWSLLEFILFDAIWEAAAKIGRILSKVYNGITNIVFRDFNKDFK